uniref:Uncharacterized protein n=2 Tax=Parascaris univalens TaxID=6257 RepID=A0A914ZXP3_PARUN
MHKCFLQMSCDACSMKGFSSASQVYRLCGKLTENALGTSEVSMQRLGIMKEKVAISGHLGTDNNYLRAWDCHKNQCYLCHEEHQIQNKQRIL